MSTAPETDPLAAAEVDPLPGSWLLASRGGSGCWQWRTGRRSVGCIGRSGWRSRWSRGSWGLEEHGEGGVAQRRAAEVRAAGTGAKGLVERLHDYLERSFLPGRTFTGPADFNAQISTW